MGSFDSFHIAIDVGSTSIKGAILDLDANDITSVRALPFPTPTRDLPPGRIEIHAESVVACVVELVQRLSVGLQEQGHLWICGQMGGVILADTQGNALSPYISWRDQRSLEPHRDGQSWMQTLRDCWSEEVWANLGRELQPGSTSTLLYWLQQHELLPSQAMPCSIADFVVSRLTQSPPAMHDTYAIGLLDLQQKDWHRDAMTKIGLDRLEWPTLVHGIEPIAVWHFGGRRYEIHGCFGDHQTALWGAGLQRDELSINASTGSQVSHRTTQFEPGPYQSRLFFGGDWLNTVTHLPAGRSLNALVQLCTELSEAEGLNLNHSWETIAKKMSVIPQTDLIANINFYSSPLGSKGSLLNLTTENLTVGHLFLAAVKAMADNYRAVADQFAPARSFRSLVLSGGLPQALPRLVDFISERFLLPLRQVHGEDTLLGLLKLARHFSASSSNCST